jgi:hypothetical protein
MAGAAAGFLLLRPVAVNVADVTRRDLAPAIQGVGTVEAKVTVLVGSKITGRLVMDLLRRLGRERKAAVIAVTHDERMLEGFDRVYHMIDGRIDRSGRPDRPARDGV